MSFIAKSLIQPIAQWYSEINSATLTGAIDVIVIEQEDGSFLSSPFHVRFGKLGVLKAKEKVVDLVVNDEPVDIHMKLEEHGVAYFAREIVDINNDSPKDIPPELATSPIPFENETVEPQLEFCPEKLPSESKGKNARKKRRKRGSQHRRTGSKGSVMFGSDDLILEDVNDADEEDREDCTDGGVMDDRTMNKPPPTENPNDSMGSPHSTHVVPSLVETRITTSEIETSSNIIHNDLTEKVILDDYYSDPETRCNHHNQISNLRTSASSTPNDGLNLSTSLSVLSDTEFNLHSEKEDVHLRPVKRLVHKRDGLPNCHQSLWEWGELPKKEMATDDISISYKYMCNNNTDKNHLNTVESEKEVPVQSKSKSSNSWLYSFWSKKQETTPEKTTTVQKGATYNSDVEGGTTTSVKDVTTMKSRPKSADRIDKGLYLEDLPHDDQKLMAIYLGRNSLPSSTAINVNDRQDDDRESGNGNSLPMSPNAILDGSSGVMGMRHADRHRFESGVSVYMNARGESRRQTIYYSSDDDDGVVMSDHRFSNLNRCSITDVEFSLCGGFSPDQEVFKTVTHESFDRHIITYESFMDSLSVNNYSQSYRSSDLFSNPNLVVRLRIGGNGSPFRYYPWSVAQPLIFAGLIYGKSLPNNIIDSLLTRHFTPSAESQSHSVSEISVPPTNNSMEENSEVEKSEIVTDTNVENNEPSVEKDVQATDKISDEITTTDVVDDKVYKQNRSSWWPFGGGSTSNSPKGKSIRSVSVIEKTTSSPRKHLKSAATCDDDHNYSHSNTLLDDFDDNDDLLSEFADEIRKVDGKEATSVNGKRYIKSLRLTTDCVKRLNLRPGMNEIQFSVTTAYQGTTKCSCHIYWWRWNDKIVVSDIDGTITKSDVLGHVLPIIGRDWAQSGVASLFTRIVENGFHIVYLSARAIGQASITKGYLSTINQGDVYLPDGPVLLNPTSLVNAFHREVIEKKPEIFKIACLKDIKNLFPSNPFYAGYGNRINDVFAYRAVGIPLSRIFTINYKGEIKHEINQTIKSSYNFQQSIVDYVFPPLPRDSIESHVHRDVEGEEFTTHTLIPQYYSCDHDTFSSYNFWKLPPAELSSPSESK